MSREIALARGRLIAEAGMVDACMIRRLTGGATNPDTGTPVPVYTTLYAGKCRIQQRAASGAGQREPGEDFVLMLALEVQLPMSVTDLEVGDEVVVTTSAHDADLPGRTLLVRGLAHKSHATARRVACEERTAT